MYIFILQSTKCKLNVKRCGTVQAEGDSFFPGRVSYTLTTSSIRTVTFPNRGCENFPLLETMFA